MRVQKVLPTLLVGVVALIAGALCLVMPPLFAFEPRPVVGIALVITGTAAALWRGTQARVRAGAHLVGAVLLWGTILWCALSQVVSFYEPASVILARRALPILLFAGIWAYFWLPRVWQQRTAVAVVVPCVLAFIFAGWVNTPNVLYFQPYYLAVDSHQTLYATDRDTPVIRVFAPDGTLRAKLWPGLASRQGPPGPGFSPTGPYGDPDRLGLSPIKSINKSVTYWTPLQDPFQFCGLAVDSHDRLYVPDPKHEIMLRFTDDGRLQTRWPLPQGYQAPSGCIAMGQDRLYVADQRGVVLALTPDGQKLTHWQMPEPIGDITVSPDGRSIYALSSTHVYAVDVQTGKTASWPLTTTSGGIAALSSGRVAVGNHLSPYLDIYCTDGTVCGRIGTTGAWPGQFGQVGGLTTDQYGRIYVADYLNRVVQCFTPAGHVTALYWSVEDDEQGEGKRV